jgi:hypothetical protein
VHLDPVYPAIRRNRSGPLGRQQRRFLRQCCRGGG